MNRTPYRRAFVTGGVAYIELLGGKTITVQDWVDNIDQYLEPVASLPLAAEDPEDT